MRHCYASYARGNRVCEWCYFVRGSSQRSSNGTSRALVLSPWCRLDHACMHVLAGVNSDQPDRCSASGSSATAAVWRWWASGVRMVAAMTHTHTH